MHESYLRARSYALIGLTVVVLGFLGLVNRGLPDFCYPVAFVCMLVGPMLSIVGLVFAPSSMEFNFVGGLVWLLASIFALGLGVHSVYRLFFGQPY